MSSSSNSSESTEVQGQTGFTQFIAETPVVVPPVSEIVYDKYWLRLMTITSPTPSEPAKMYAEFRPCRDIDSLPGKEVKTPEVNGDIKVITIDDIFTFIGNENEDPVVRNLAVQAMEMIFRTLNAYAKSKGVF